MTRIMKKNAIKAATSTQNMDFSISNASRNLLGDLNWQNGSEQFNLGRSKS